MRSSPPALVARSLTPPPPLGGTAHPCAASDAVAEPVCQSSAPPRPLTSHPPPGAALGCYTGTIVDGRYEIGTVLGQGGMGVVYAARHVVIGKRCAVKILRSEVASDPDIAERFLQEARAASSIGNLHIIDISDFGRFPDGTTYFVMEYLDGRPLSSLIKEPGAITAPRLVHIARQIASGLGAAHARGIVHRDLKPDNIMLSTSKEQLDFVKILDFGIAKVSAGPRVTMAGRLFGTPYYMSPEQAGGGSVDSRTDIYALGVIMYEMASGRVPFDGDTLMGILTQHIYQKPVPPRELVGGAALPPGLERVILKALAKDASQRYQTMQELAVDLELLAMGASPAGANIPLGACEPTLQDSQAGRGMALPIPASPPKRRVPWAALSAISAILVACLVVVTAMARGRAGTASHATSASSEPTPAAAIARDPAASPATLDTTVTAPAPTSSSTALNAEPRKDAVTVFFAAEPLDAHVYLGHRDLGPTPVSVDVQKRAPQVLDVRAPGYQPARVKVDGTRQRVTVKLVPLKRRSASRQPAVDTSNGIVNPWGK